LNTRCVLSGGGARHQARRPASRTVAAERVRSNGWSRSYPVKKIQNQHHGRKNYLLNDYLGVTDLWLNFLAPPPKTVRKRREPVNCNVTRPPLVSLELSCNLLAGLERVRAKSQGCCDRYRSDFSLVEGRHDRWPMEMPPQSRWTLPTKPGCNSRRDDGNIKDPKTDQPEARTLRQPL